MGAADVVPGNAIIIIEPVEDGQAVLVAVAVVGLRAPVAGMGWREREMDKRGLSWKMLEESREEKNRS